MKQNICDQCKLQSITIKWQSNNNCHQACIVKKCAYNWYHDHKLCIKCKNKLDRLKDSCKDLIIKELNKKI
jgi:hypothetical protein